MGIFDESSFCIEVEIPPFQGLNRIASIALRNLCNADERSLSGIAVKGCKQEPKALPSAIIN